MREVARPVGAQQVLERIADTRERRATGMVVRGDLEITELPRQVRREFRLATSLAAQGVELAEFPQPQVAVGESRGDGAVVLPRHTAHQLQRLGTLAHRPHRPGEVRRRHRVRTGLARDPGPLQMISRHLRAAAPSASPSNVPVSVPPPALLMSQM